MRNYLIILTIISSIASYSQTISRGPDFGEIYFFGFTVTQGDDGIYRSVDYGYTALCKDSTTQNSYNMTAIAADKANGVLYHINMNGGLYYSSDYGTSNSWEYKHGNISPIISSGENEGFVHKHIASHSENYGSNFNSHNTNGFFGIIKYAEIDAGSDLGYCISRKYNIPDTIYFFKAYNHFDSLENVNKLIFNWSDNIELSRGNNSGEVFLCNKSTNKLYFSLDFGASWIMKNYFSCPNLPIVGITGGRHDGELYLHVVYTQLMGERRHVYIYHSIDYGETFTIYHPISIGPDPIYANFIAVDTLVEPDDIVQFTDLSNDAETWEWDFDNDGTIDSYEQNPTYAYSDTGYYSVKLSIIGSVIQDFGIRYNYIHVKNLVGVAEQKCKYEIDYYPNPFNNHISIETRSDFKMIEIYDLNGKCHSSKTLLQENKTEIIDLRELEKGIYILKIRTEKQDITKKIIKI